MKLTLIRELAFVALLSLVLVTRTSAQVPLSGSISDGVGGPLLSGVVYHATGSLAVPMGSTLTVQAGAILKFPVSAQFNVSGQLDVLASVGSPAIFTAITDDSAGGDTPADGPSAGSPGYWRGTVIVLGGVMHASGLETRYTGQSGYAGLQLTTTSGTTLTDCSFRDYSAGGIDYGGNGLAAVTGCTFTNGNIPVLACYLDALATFTGNSASGNSVHDSVEIGGAAATGSFTIPASSVMGGAHKMMSSFTIASGAMVTIDAGVVFKFATVSQQITVQGSLLANGTSGAPVVFTEFRDDAHGGDSNKDGSATVPAKGFWRGITFVATSSSSSLTHTIIRYTGQSGIPAITLNDADIDLDSCVIDHSASAGIDVNASLPSVTSCDFSDVTIPIRDCSIGALPNFSGNTAANCTIYNVIETNTSTLPASVSFGGPNLINGTLACSLSITVPAGETLSIDQGAVLKFAAVGASLTVNGTLLCDGSGGEVVFTTIADDSHGGDSNADGPSSGSPGQWRGIGFTSGASASTLDHVRVRFSGQSGYSGVTISGADISLTNSTIEDCSNDALSFGSMASAATVAGCALDRCLVAVDSVLLPTLANFGANTASGNTLRDSIRVTGATLTTVMALGQNNVINDVIEFVGSLTVDPAASLTLGQGLVIKMASVGARITTQGSLICQGTSAQPVVFTEIRDDQFAGDTNKDGASLGIAGTWRGLLFTAGSDSSSLNHVRVFYCGQSAFSAVEINNADIVMTNSIVSDCSNAAVQLNGTSAKPTIENCAFNNATHSIRGLSWGSLAFIRDNTASGNSTLDCPLVETGSVVGAVSIQARSMIAGAIVVTVAPGITAGNSLTFERGVVVKVQGPLSFASGSGELHLRGTGAEPVVFTSVKDDEYGGDSNKNGPSAGVRGDWRGFIYSSTGSSIVEHALIRYGGQASFSALKLDSPMTTIESVRVEHALVDGFELLKNSGPLDNLVAFDCGGAGILLTTAAQIGDIRFATVTACTTGIVVSPAQTATIQSTICWGNTTNFSGISAGQLFDSNGEPTLAGMDGNIDVDPLFVDATPAVGDLTLQVTSPSIDAGNFGLGMTVANDHIEGSRILDHDLDGNVGADQGAYEFANWNTTFSGRPVIGEGMTFTLNGVPAFGVITIALLDYIYYYPPYGMVLVGSPFTQLLQDFAYVNYGYPILIPNDPYAVGYKFGVQMGAAVYGNLGVGNISSLYRGTIQD